MNKTFLVLLALIFVQASQIVSAQQSKFIKYKQELDRCYRITPTSSSISCLTDLNSKLDTLIENKYKSLIALIDNQKKQPDAEPYLDEYKYKLSLAQHSWKMYIHTNCEAVAIPFFQGVGVYGVIHNERCLAQEKINRLEGLENFYTQ